MNRFSYLRIWGDWTAFGYKNRWPMFPLSSAGSQSPLQVKIFFFALIAKLTLYSIWFKPKFPSYLFFKLLLLPLALHSLLGRIKQINCHPYRSLTSLACIASVSRFFNDHLRLFHNRDDIRNTAVLLAIPRSSNMIDHQVQLRICEYMFNDLLRI
jgi:hypothetical protein